MFRPISPQVNLPNKEEDVLRSWKVRHIFDKSKALHRDGPKFVFFEGPPSANGKPGVHHVLARAFKDLFLRYKTMRGYQVIRRGGWDTHGLPVEIEVERKLGFTSKTQIEEFGIARFNELCRQSAFEYIQEWEKLSDRIAYWIDLEDAYVTYTKEYIESVWWILKSLWDKKLLYQSFKVVPYCPRCGTPLSDHEVALGYRQTVDPSIYVRLPLVEDPGTSLLVWTTTPWTLPANVAVAVNPEVDYAIVELSLPESSNPDKPELARERLILARDMVDRVFGDQPVEIYETFKGTKLKGLRYKPLFTLLLPDKPAYYVVLEDFVNTEEGTGLVHIAPAFGAQDLQTALNADLPILITIAEDGSFIPEIRPWSGQFVKHADPLIVQDLQTRGLLLKAESYTHTYPFCWRCETPLLYYARNTWYIHTTQYKEALVALNQRINWHPDYIKDGRFGIWLENNVDWALGRERYWGTPLPIWECRECHQQLALGSLAELSELAHQDLSSLDLHRPYVDEVHIQCPECNGQMARVSEIIDVWFDSGAMPVAQWHYPFENQETFREQFPADFICEGVDQTRGWFYSLHALSTMLFEQECYKNAMSLGLILDEKGQKMSKSGDNLLDPWDVINAYGSDTLRWYLYTAGPPGQDRRFSMDLVGEVVRAFTLTLWNVYVFFITYARLDNWVPKPGNGKAAEQTLPAGLPYTDLDRWLRSELHTLVGAVTTALDSYEVVAATRPVQAFVERLSNWYLRRSRKRFWKSGSDADKVTAYSTLYEVLVTLSKLLAPTMPILADELYQNLVCSVDAGAPESVHLTGWPSYQAKLIDQKLNRDMQMIMRLASLGHAARNQAGIKVRQPLSYAAVSLSKDEEGETLERFAGLLQDELNVKQVRVLSSRDQAVSYRLFPISQYLGQKYKAKYPAVREAIMALDVDKAAQDLLAGKSIELIVQGESYKITPDELEVRVEAHPGLAVAADGTYLVALNTELDQELLHEGLAREFVRHLQALRKQSGFDIADRLILYVQASTRLAQAINAHRDYIMGEVLAVEIKEAKPPGDMTSFNLKFEDETVTIGLGQLN